MLPRTDPETKDGNRLGRLTLSSQNRLKPINIFYAVAARLRMIQYRLRAFRRQHEEYCVTWTSLQLLPNYEKSWRESTS